MTHRCSWCSQYHQQNWCTYVFFAPINQSQDKHHRNYWCSCHCSSLWNL